MYTPPGHQRPRGSSRTPPPLRHHQDATLPPRWSNPTLHISLPRIGLLRLLTRNYSKPFTNPSMAAAASPARFYGVNIRSFAKSTPRSSIRSHSFFVALSSSSPSPFTESTSTKRYRRDSWAYGSADLAARFSSSPLCDKENEIALQLPELKRLLETLKAAKNSSGDGGGGGGGGRPGSVVLVGTGPGDPELLTLKAVWAIERADLILYDRLVSNDVLSLVRGNARLLYVGKTAGYHSRTQEEIHELLLNFAEAGANVVRLKGGDPLVFGRGGEEMDFLQQQGIEVKVIPGITSASGIAAELGIPLTHRGIANSVRFLTGHSRNGGTDPLYVAEHAADPESTLVIYMGLSTLPGLASKLMKHGLSPKTPAVAVERGTTPQQQTVFAELDKLVSEVKLADLVSPTLIIIGQVVALSPLWPRSSEEQSELKIRQSCSTRQ